MHAVVAVILAYEPIAHVAHADVPVARLLYLPAAQPVHTDDDDAPARVLYVPAAQPVHAADVMAPDVLL